MVAMVLTPTVLYLTYWRWAWRSRIDQVVKSSDLMIRLDLFGRKSTFPRAPRILLPHQHIYPRPHPISDSWLVRACVPNKTRPSRCFFISNIFSYSKHCHDPHHRIPAAICASLKQTSPIFNAFSTSTSIFVVWLLFHACESIDHYGRCDAHNDSVRDIHSSTWAICDNTDCCELTCCRVICQFSHVKKDFVQDSLPGRRYPPLILVFSLSRAPITLDDSQSGIDEFSQEGASTDDTSILLQRVTQNQLKTMLHVSLVSRWQQLKPIYQFCVGQRVLVANGL